MTPTSSASAPVDLTRLRDLVASSVELIEAEQHPGGAYPACTTFSVYGFAWLRDGSFTAEALTRHGRVESPAAFHDWVSAVVASHRDRVEAIVAATDAGSPVDPAQCLPTRYELDGGEGPPGWWDFQLDGYGIWLWALSRHLQRHGLDPAPYQSAIELTIAYLAALWRMPCYDWWEEHEEQVHVSTLTTVAAGLRAALTVGVRSDDLATRARRSVDEIATLVATQGTTRGRLRKWLGSEEVDGSLLSAIAPFGVVTGAAATATLAAVEADLLADRGVHRFRADVFYGGGRWPVLAGLLGEVYARYGRHADAMAQLDWIAGCADSDGHLPEQVSDQLLAPTSFQPWVDRWGAVARPLLWSHAGYLSLAAELGVRA